MSENAKSKPPQQQPVTVTVTRAATVYGTDGKPALEIVLSDGEVKVTALPKNGQRRSPVTLANLKNALTALEA